MNIEIKVVTRAKRPEIMREGAGLKIKLISLPREGRANEELVETLAAFFGVRKSEVVILRGEKDKRKVVSVPITGDEFMAKISGVREA